MRVYLIYENNLRRNINIRNNFRWYDGFSTYYINGDGKVYKHVADKVMPDQDIVAKKDDLHIAPKLALFKNLTNVLDNATRTSMN